MREGRGGSEISCDDLKRAEEQGEKFARFVEKA
jgi:hypothetical protein